VETGGAAQETQVGGQQNRARGKETHASEEVNERWGGRVEAYRALERHGEATLLAKDACVSIARADDLAPRGRFAERRR